MRKQNKKNNKLLLERITISPDICHGKPCIRVEEILADYEDLEREDILAALAFATRLSKIKRVQPHSA
jgi:uncharacterized protein (DUF433 family)